ncbi:MAG TPA: GNAT family N-acetyltransferase [Xanthomonadaceae bacterium]|nr:GNAT family N-acetyltransferase [Xanthomonadaceae bacterium]
MPVAPAFRVAVVDYADARPELHAVRETVFVREQQVPAELERDALDPACVHVLARDDAGRPIGTGRLTPERRIGRMAVLREWRGRGVGDAMLGELLHAARGRGWREVTLNAQTPAIDFYLRHGFTAFGPRFMEAGIEHQAMRRPLGVHAIDNREAACAAVAALVHGARRHLWIYTREGDPGLLDDAGVLDALRRFGTAGRSGEARILLQDAAAPQRAHAPLLALAQRLPSVFLFREPADPVDRAYPSAFVTNDAGGFYFRALGHRFDGEADLHAPGRARQLRLEFEAFWERARPVSEYRALGI